MKKTSALTCTILICSNDAVVAHYMTILDKLARRNRRHAKLRWGSNMRPAALDVLRNYSEEFQLSVASGDLLFLDQGWYVTNSGLTRLARRIGALAFTSNRCRGSPILRRRVGLSKPPCINPETVKDSLAMAMPIRQMFLLSFAAPKCAWPRRAP